MCPNSHIHHNSCVFWHSYCAIIRAIQCFQLMFNTFKWFVVMCIMQLFTRNVLAKVTVVVELCLLSS